MSDIIHFENSHVDVAMRELAKIQDMARVKSGFTFTDEELADVRKAVREGMEDGRTLNGILSIVYQQMDILLQFKDAGHVARISKPKEPYRAIAIEQRRQRIAGKIA